MGFNEVCDECSRHVAVAGHNPDCPNSVSERDAHGDNRNNRKGEQPVCEGCGSADCSYRPSMGVYTCEGCHNKGVRAYMEVFD